MRVRHYAQGKFYTIACPEGTRIIRAANQADGDAAPHDHLVVPLNGKEMRIPGDPPELLPLLAETGNFGVSLDGEPEPEHRLAGATCPGCGQDDVNWLQLVPGVEAIHCDRCGTDFDTPLRHITSVPSSEIADD